MKSVKLKPLMVSENEVFVKPPEFLLSNAELPLEKFKNVLAVFVKDIKPYLHRKKISKEAKEKKVTENDEESVKKLSEWKRSITPVSPLLRKYTFKRQGTFNLVACDNNPKARSAAHAGTIISKGNTRFDSLVSKVYGIVAAERFKKKNLDEHFSRIAQRNQDHEEVIKRHMYKLKREIQDLKSSIETGVENLKEIQQKIVKLQKKHEERLRKIKQQETEDLLFNSKTKQKKVLKQGEESQYLIKKEKIRQIKQDYHKQFQEELEVLNYDKEKTEKILEINSHDRQKNKKELNELKEEICTLYLSILKDGKDLRTDGLRWVIKSLWVHKEFIPVSAFPKFLDEESIYFLLRISEKDLEFNHCQEKIEKIRKNLQDHRSSSSVSSSRELYLSVRKRLRDISKSVISYDLNGRNTADIFNGSKLESRDSNTYNELSTYRGKIQEISKLIKEETDAEIKRTTELYQICPGKAEKFGLFHVIKCLVGEKVREFNKYTRSQQKKKITIAEKLVE